MVFFHKIILSQLGASHWRRGLTRFLIPLKCLDLGGYDEDLTGYGYDDHWLLIRAMQTGKNLMWWGSQGNGFAERIKTPRNVVGANMREKTWRKTELANKAIASEKFYKEEWVSNKGRDWGAANVTKNFDAKIIKI